MEDIKPYNTLFLDRDGVINQQRPYDYVKTTGEFIFIDGALEALRLLSPLFKHIIIVTNQRGVGKGIMTRKDLEEIHAYMMNEVSGQGGRIDKIYVCTDTSDYCKNRKPNTGLALQPKMISRTCFTKSIMAGDSISVQLFAKSRDKGSIYRKQIWPGRSIKNTLPGPLCGFAEFCSGFLLIMLLQLCLNVYFLL